MCSEAAEEKRTQRKAESTVGLCYSRVGGKRRALGTQIPLLDERSGKATDTELPVFEDDFLCLK